MFKLPKRNEAASVVDNLKADMHERLDAHADQIAHWTEVRDHAERMRTEHYAAANAINAALLTFVEFTGEDLLSGLDGSNVRQISAT